MRKFIDRINDDYEYQREFEKEPLFFKCFLFAIIITYWLFKAIFAIVACVTSPIWVVPYAIWWTKKK